MRRVQIRSTSAASRIAAQSLAPSHRRCRSPNEVVLCWLCPLSFCLYRFYHDLVSSPVFRPRPCLPLCSRVAYLCPRKPLNPPSAYALLCRRPRPRPRRPPSVPSPPPAATLSYTSGPRDLISIFPIGNVPEGEQASRVRTKKGRRPCGREKDTNREGTRGAGGR